jgi:hypothetical protein
MLISTESVGRISAQRLATKYPCNCNGEPNRERDKCHKWEIFQGHAKVENSREKKVTIGSQNKSCHKLCDKCCLPHLLNVWSERKSGCVHLSGLMWHTGEKVS